MYTQLIFIMNKCQELGSFTDDQNSKLGAGREQGKAPLIYKVWYKWLSCIFDRIFHNSNERVPPPPPPWSILPHFECFLKLASF